MNIHFTESDTFAKYPNDVKWCKALSLKTLMVMIFSFMVIWFMIEEKPYIYYQRINLGSKTITNAF